MTDTQTHTPPGRTVILDEAFLADLPYDPEVLLIDREIVLTDDGVLATMRTDVPLPYTVSQRAHPTRHPAHVNGGTMIHLTGMMALVHAYHHHGLRHGDGWIGFGVRIEKAVFHKLARLGPPLKVSCRELRSRIGTQKGIARYAFEMHQEGVLAYSSQQTGFFMNTDAGASLDLGGGGA